MTPRFRDDPVSWRLHLVGIGLNVGLALGATLDGDWWFAVRFAWFAALNGAIYWLLVVLEALREARQ